MAAAASVFLRVRTGSKVGAEYDQEGQLIQVESREDEEQTVKLAEILELLLAAGYFRARIKGLSPFDKVVGGMTWCITTCNFDIDVDLLFQENSTIGQKIALTEKIVSVLPKMKCPHHLEPHQIQGLDFIHIFPVIQWLVKRAIETREEMGDYVRAYSISQFQKSHVFPEHYKLLQRKDKAVKAVLDVLEVYKPERKYRRQKDAELLLDEESRIHFTLLEYGRMCEAILRYGLNKQCKQNKEEDAQVSGPQAIPAGIADVLEEDKLQAAEEGKLTASAVGQIVGLQSEEIKLIASEYAGKQLKRSSEEQSERFGPVQQHRRAVASLDKRIQQKAEQLKELKVKHAEVKARNEEAKRNLLEATEHSTKLETEMKSLEEMEEQADSGLMEKLRALVTMNENLKQQEQQFRTHCREEMVRLQQNIEELKSASGQDTEEQERRQLIDQQYNSDSEKLQKVRLLMARRNREIAILQRKIDEVPSRAELTQYQKRFIELYSQVSATHKETKQFFTLYNTLDDKKVYLEKEVNLLNSIHDNFQQAMSSAAARDQFLRQMEQIVDGIKQSRIKMEKKKQENKMRRDQLNDEYLELLDKQRLYFKTVKDFKEECRKNEMLLSKLRAKGAS
ncbi:LOW QUALITY PROTEIN: coiled-coil domain-containing protein 93-like [Poeciliopsis prolifica]|uniref:LOW QUALITY PROTEIN: coiled-coil domain-containing protein 93-like n=1 Tax=Poeciliopsis prolifica TaxID=188132 RepID=UPI0024140E43|nr:LOW QUALITY PROTEIN: coiled-coil domain-containing protein 93-like [Poeciliopsis prolifica]